MFSKLKTGLSTWLVALASLAGSLGFAQQQTDPVVAESGGAPARPNVIVIVTDDQGWADVGFNNADVYSPNIDKLAGEGMVFRQHYVMPQCTPTRVALFTGRYPGRFGNAALAANNAPVFPKSTYNMARLFKSSGYRTFLVGKWHMGSSLDHGPNHHGFDHSYGSLTGAVGMYDHRYRTGKFENTWQRDLELIEGGEQGIHATDLVAAEAVRVIQTEAEDPFFLYLAFHAVHTPLDERGEFVDEPTQLDSENPDRWAHEDEIPWFNDPAGKIQNEPDPEKRLLLAAVHHLDSAIGQVVAALEESGKREQTLILFTSDNGPQVNWGGNAYPDDLRLTDFNQPLPFRGFKTHVWEGGIHVPGFANWPGQIDAGTTLESPTHVIDWLPTLADVLGVEVDPENKLDGTSIWPALQGETVDAQRDFYWIWNTRTNRWALRHGDWKIVRYGQGEPSKPTDWQLFNLAEDPAEKTDVADKFPEQLQALHTRFLKHRAKDKTD